MEGHSRAPWVNDRESWGRIRLTKRMWHTTYLALSAYIDAVWTLHHSQPNPSPESRASLTEIRELQKVLDNLKGLGEEKAWPIPGFPREQSNGSSGTE